MRVAVAIIVAVLGAAYSPAPLGAQPPDDLDALLAELAARIVAVAGSSAQAFLAVDPASTLADVETIRMRLATQLGQRGMTIVQDGSASIRAACIASLRERACSADVVRGDVTETVVAARPFATTVRSNDAAPAAQRLAPALQLQPIFSQASRILDLVLTGDRLVVLDPAAVSTYQRDDDGWRQTWTASVSPSRPWPRDMRGRLQVDGDDVTAFLPGADCAGTIGSGSLRCAERQRPWPLGIDNRGLERNGNDFSTPEGIPFVAVAALGSDAGAAWLLVERGGSSRWLNASRARLADGPAAEDVARLSSACDSETHVVLASRDDERDALTLYRVAGRRLTVVGSRLPLAGRVTALWTAADMATVFAVVHDAHAGRYDAFRASISCRR